jgi:UPF0755 protein
MFKKSILILFFFLLVLLPIIFFVWWSNVTKPINSSNNENVLVVIPNGWGVEQIAKKLEDENLISSVLAFKLMVAKEGISTKLQAGDFFLSPSMNMYEIIQNLTHGTVDVWVTIPEGLRREEIAEILANTFLKHNITLNILEFLDLTEDKEGFLFPDTYLIPKNSSSNQIVKILNAGFDNKYSSLEPKISLTQNQIVVLASLIEREAKYDKDRPIIAGIFIKRLMNGWTLDVDATLQYALANNKCDTIDFECNWWPSITVKEKDIVSPFNTYVNKGLPPAPICNPGLASLKAAANPKDTDYWFYLSDLSGNIYYAKTNEEHLNNYQYLSK